MKNFKVRNPMYFIGLFIMTIGIVLSVKSNLGVPPVSSIPYTMTCVGEIEMGKGTILAAVLVGCFVGLFTKTLGAARACDQVRKVNHQRAVRCHYFTKIGGTNMTKSY